MATFQKVISEDSNGVVSVSSKLGVGTSSPSDNLHVVGGALIKPSSGIGQLIVEGHTDARLVLKSDLGGENGDWWYIKAQDADQDLTIINGSTERARFTDTTVRLGGTSGFEFTDAWTGIVKHAGNAFMSINGGASGTMSIGDGGRQININSKLDIGGNKLWMVGNSTSGNVIDMYSYGGVNWDLRSYYNEKFIINYNSGNHTDPTYTPAFVISNRDNDGNVGIAEVSPTHRLEVKGHVAITDGYNLFMKRDGSSLRFTADGKSGGTNRGEYYMSADGTMNWTIGGINRMSLTGNGPSVSNIYTPSIVAAGGDSINMIASGVNVSIGADYDNNYGNIDLYPTGKNIGVAKTVRFSPSSAYFYKPLDITTDVRNPFTRTTSLTNTTTGVLSLKNQTTGNMVDNFGASLDFQIRDSAGADNTIAKVAGIRDGADNQGGLVFHTASVGGTSTERMRINVLGNVGIGTTNPTQKLMLGTGNMLVTGGGIGINISHSPDNPLHIENGSNGMASIRLEDARTGDNTIDAGGFLDFYANHHTANRHLGRVQYSQSGNAHSSVRFKITGTLAGVGGKKLIVNDDNGVWKFYNNYTQDEAMIIKNSQVGVNTFSPERLLHLKQGADDNGIRLSGHDDMANRDADIYLDQYGQLNIKNNVQSDGLGNPHINFIANQNGAVYMYPQLRVGNSGISAQGAVDLKIGGLYDSDIKLLNSSGNAVLTVDAGNSRVGIGTTSPATLVHLNASEPVMRLTSANHGSSAGALEFWKESNSPADDDQLGHLRWVGSDDAGNLMYMAVISAYSDDVTNGSEDASLRFTTTDAGVNAERMRLQGSKLGIGTTSPQKTLHVSQTGTGDLARFESTGESFSIQYMADDSGTPVNYQFTHLGNKAIHYNNGNVVHASLKTGEVGIGTDSPSLSYSGGLHIKNASNVANLKVSGGSSTGFDLWQDTGGNAYVINHDNAGILFKTNGGDRAYIKNDGKIGIGTTSPDSLLEIESSGSTGHTLAMKNTSENANVNLKLDFLGNDGVNNNSKGHLLWSNTTNQLHLNSHLGLRFQISETTKFLLDADSRMSLSNNDAGIDNTTYGKRAGKSITSGGNYNTLIGRYAGEAITTGDTNTVVGTNAHYANVTGSNNTAIGYISQFGASSQSFSNNTSVGAESLRNVTTGTQNIALGTYALSKNTTAHNNVAIGHNSMLEIRTGDKNVAIGSFAMSTNHDGNSRESKESVFVGYNSGAGTWANNQSHYNTAIGAWTMDAGLNGAMSNTAIGYQALSGLTEGDYNTAIGKDAGLNMTTGTNNVAVGHGALYSATTGYYNVAVGDGAGAGITEGLNNVTIGRASGYAITTGDNNIAIGKDSLKTVTTTDAQIAIGFEALKVLTTGLYNTAIGHQAGKAMTANTSNTVIGHSAFSSANGNENQNVVIGAGAGDSIDQDQTDNNVIIGKEAWRGGVGLLSGSVVIGSEAAKTPHVRNVYDSVFIGHKVAFQEFGGGCNYNVGIGTLAMSAGNLNDAHGNVAVGWKAMEALTQSDNNVAIGREALKSILAGDGANIALGYLSGRDVTSGNKNIFIGSEAGRQQTTGSGSVNIGFQAGVVDSSSANVIIGHLAFSASNNSSSASNVILGFESATGINYISSEHNVIIGRGAGTGGGAQFTKNIAIGSYALDNTLGNTTLGQLAIGYEALTLVTSGLRNMAIGYQSGKSITTQDDNTFVGFQSGRATTGAGNTALGKYSMYEGAGADYNTAIGTNALQNVTNDNNTAVGYEAGTYITSGHENTFVGSGAGRRLQTGDENVGIGYYALSGALTGDANVGVGYNTLSQLTSGVDNVAIGNDAGAAVTTGSYNIFIGDHNIGTSGMNGHTIIGTPDTDKTNLLGKIALYSASNWAYYSHYAHRYSTSDYAVKQKNDGTTYLNAKDAKKVHLAVNDANKLTVSGDWVGIGTSTPTQKLDISGGIVKADGIMYHGALNVTASRLYGNGANTYFDSAYQINFRSGSTPAQAMIIKTDGKVGIGRTDPAKTLDITGDFRVSSTATMTGNASVGGTLVVDGDFEVGTTTAFYDDVAFNGVGVDLSNCPITGLNVSVTPTATNVFKSATNANNINFGSSTTVGNVSFAGGGVKNTTHITHTDNGSQVTLKTAGEYNISTNLVVTNDDSTDRFTAFSYVYHYNSGGTLLHKYGLEAIYIRGTGNNYNSGGMAGQIKLVVSANDYILVRVMVLDREGTGTIPLDAGYSDIRIDKITYSTT